MEHKHDTQGRWFIAHHDVRGALVSAAVSVSTGTPTSLIAGDSDYFLDIVELSFANASTASASVVIVNDGTPIRTFQVPASNTSRMSFDAPMRQQTKGTPWFIDMEDITGTTISVDAVLIKKPNN